MSTKAQIKANRLNAQKSTGPQTDEGKEKVAQNAQKHGLFAQKDVIFGENQADYDMLRAELLEELKPIGPTQNILAERVVSLSWRLMRTEKLQNYVLDSMIEKHQRFHSSDELTLGHVARKDFGDTRILDKLMMYERRIENSMYKTMAELKKLQAVREDDEENHGLRHKVFQRGGAYDPLKKNRGQDAHDTNDTSSWENHPQPPAAVEDATQMNEDVRGLFAQFIPQGNKANLPQAVSLGDVLAAEDANEIGYRNRNRG